MKITVNNTTLHIFEGAKVKDAIRMYYAQLGKQSPDSMPVVKDKWRHKVGNEGTLLPNAVLHIQNENKQIRNRIIKYFKCTNR